MRTFESAGELDKALLDGSFENMDHIKQEPTPEEDHPELSLTPEEQEGMRASTRLLEVAQQLQAMAEQAEAEGLGMNLANKLAERAAALREESVEAHGLPAEVLETKIDRANSDLENFQFSVHQHQEAQQTDRVDEARQDIQEAFEEPVEAAPIAQSEVTELARPYQPREVPRLRTREQIIDEMKALSTEAKAKKNKSVAKDAKAYAKTLAREYKALSKMSGKGASYEDIRAAKEEFYAKADKIWANVGDRIDNQ